MDSRTVIVALTASTSAVLGALGFVLTAHLDVFAPCRLAYGVAATVRASLACQLHAAITLFSLLLCVVAGAAAIVVGVRVYLTRRYG